MRTTVTSLYDTEIVCSMSIVFVDSNMCNYQLAFNGYIREKSRLNETLRCVYTLRSIRNRAI